MLSDSNEEVRRLAVEKTTDEKTLLEITEKDRGVRIKITAIHVMSNIDRLMEILLNDPDSNCRHAAFRRLLEMAPQLTWEKHMIIQIMEQDGKDWIYHSTLCPFCGGNHCSWFTWEDDYNFILYDQRDCDECGEIFSRCQDITHEIEDVKRVFGL